MHLTRTYPLPPPSLDDPVEVGRDAGRPASTSVSCLLMQDAVAADKLSIKDGHGTVAMFANPFRGGKEEALIIDSEGHLTYLERFGPETGWRQIPVLGEKAADVVAQEVVVVVHPRDLTLWALYTAGDGDLPHALRLTSKDKAGITTCAWISVPGAVTTSLGPVLDVRQMSVSYEGRVPTVFGFDTKHARIAQISPLMQGSRRFVANPVVTPKGQVQQLAGGYVTASNTGHRPYYNVVYTLDGHRLTRYALGAEIPIASDAAEIVGVFPSYEMPDIGCIYINADQELVTWNAAVDEPNGRYTYTAGLTGVLGASCWTDVDGMTHVYAVVAEKSGGPKSRPVPNLKVLHQVGWGPKGVPVWSQSHNDPPPDQPSGPPFTVPTWVGLVPNVARVILDPYPDYVPTQLVEYAGKADTADQFSFHSQDVTSTRWSRDKIRLTADGKPPKTVQHYMSAVTVLDRRGEPIPGLPVQISAETLVEIQVDGASYLVGPGHGVEVRTNPLGKVTVATPADSLLPATLHVDATGLEQGAIIQPAGAVHEYLAGNGTLPSQSEPFSGPAMMKARIGQNQDIPIVRGGVTEAECDQAAHSTGNVFRRAAGKPMTAYPSPNGGPAKPVYGFSIGRALPTTAGAEAGTGPVVYREFKSAQEARAHRKAIMDHPSYGGAWDDFTNWLGDVWEGVKNGVIMVAEVIVEAVTTVFIKIGEAIVKLADIIIDTVETAVRAVEAVVSQVVTAVQGMIDWLTALFSFKDIWHTKTALESAFQTTFGYAAASFSHYGGQLHGWFKDQETAVHDAFDTVRKQYLAQPVGNGQNLIPPAIGRTADGKPDPDRVVPAKDLQDNPQANWMLDQTVNPRVLGQAKLTDVPWKTDPKVDKAWDDFINVLTSSNLGSRFQSAAGDCGAVLDRLADPADPDVAKSSMIALIDLVEDLVELGLEFADTLSQALIALVEAVAATMSELIWSHELSLGPVSSLYEWIRDQSGSGDTEPMTVGGLLCLIAGFVVTVTYKLVNGVHTEPFPNGVFPALPAPDWDTRPGLPRMTPELFESDDFVAAMKAVKATCGIVMAFGSVGNALADVVPVLPDELRKPWKEYLGLLGLYNATFYASAGTILAMPPVSGKDWKEWHASSAFATSALNSVLCFAVAYGYVAGKADAPALKNIGDGIVGPPLAFLLAAVQTGFTASGPLPNEYAKAQVGLSAVPGLIQILRTAPKDKKTRGPERAFMIGAIDALVGPTAALMTAVPAFIDGPGIPVQMFADARLHVEYRVRVDRDNERAYNVPWTWSVIGSLPPGLSLCTTTGVISGTPTRTGYYAFELQVVDSYGPKQRAWRGGLGINVRAA